MGHISEQERRRLEWELDTSGLTQEDRCNNEKWNIAWDKLRKEAEQKEADEQNRYNENFGPKSFIDQITENKQVLYGIGAVFFLLIIMK